MKAVLKMVKNAIILLAGFIIFFDKATVESKTPQQFCASGEPEVIDITKLGEGEIKVDSIISARSWLIHVNIEDNCGIELHFKSFFLEHFFLVIRDGMGNGSDDCMIQFISGQSDKLLIFRIPFGKSFYMEICPEYGSTLKLLEGKFSMSVNRTVFEDNLPEEKPDVQIEKESYEVQLKGKPPEKFKDSQFALKLKQVIKNLARDYCRLSNINFDEEKPADEMVTILAVRYCPSEWYDRHICASIKHSVYVNYEHKVPAAVWNYELRRKHLYEMWEKANDSYFEELELSIYKFPNKDEVLGWWFLLIVLPSVILIVVTISVVKICSYVKEDKQMKYLADTTSTTTISGKKSKLKPDKYQNIPSFIKNQSKKSYLRKHRNLDNAEGQYAEQQSYFAALLFAKLPRSYSGNNNHTSY